jgi:hypothetical protein
VFAANSIISLAHRLFDAHIKPFFMKKVNSQFLSIEIRKINKLDVKKGEKKIFT